MDVTLKRRKRFVRTGSNYKSIEVGVDVPTVPFVTTLSLTSGGWTNWRIPPGTQAMRIACLDSAVVKLATTNTQTPSYTFKANFVYELPEMMGMGGSGHTGAPMYFQTTAASATLQILYWRDGGNLQMPASSSSTSSSSSSRCSSSSSSSSSSSPFC